MDFHSLSRRELQTLCKKNKIPANMTNIAMADALSALISVEGIEDFGKTVTTGLETPLTSRRTTTSRKVTKPQSASIENEPESSLAKTRTRRATTRKILQEDDEEENNGPKDLNEVQSISEMPKTPATRTSRKKAMGTSVSQKLNTQVKENKEGKDDKEKEIPVVPRAYSTRRSTRLQQSEQKVSESVQKKTGRRKEAVEIDMLSEEENDEKKSEVTNEGTNEMVLNANQDDLVSEDDSSTVVFAESSSSNSDAVSESFTSEKVEESNGDQDVSSEASSASVVFVEDSRMNIDQVVEESSPLEEKTQNLEESNGKCVISSPSVQDANMNYVKEDDSNAEDSSATMISTDELRRNIAHALDESPQLEGEEVQKVKESNGEFFMNSLPSAEEGNMNNDQATEMDEADEGKKIADVLDESSPLKEEEKKENQDLMMLTVEDELFDVKVAELHSETWDFGSMKDSLQEFMGNVEVEKCNLEFLEQEYQDDAVIVSLPSEASPGIQIEAENSIVNDQLENQIVEEEKSEPIADDVDEDNVDGADFDAPAVLDEEWTDSDVDESIEEDSIQKLIPQSDFVEKITLEVAAEEISFSSSANDPIMDNQIPMNISTPTKVTATAKKATTTPKSFIKVLDDNKENNESGKVSFKSFKSNSKVKTVVAEEKENNKDNKGENTAQRKLKSTSLRQLIKQIKEIERVKQLSKEMSKINISDDKTTTATENKLQLENKRPALQTLNGNSVVGDEEN